MDAYTSSAIVIRAADLSLLPPTGSKHHRLPLLRETRAYARYGEGRRPTSSRGREERVVPYLHNSAYKSSPATSTTLVDQGQAQPRLPTTRLQKLSVCLLMNDPGDRVIEQVPACIWCDAMLASIDDSPPRRYSFSSVHSLGV